MDWSSMERLALCVTSFNDEPYLVFPDNLMALCVSLHNIYIHNVSIFPSGLMCHFRPLPYMNWSSMEPLALCVTSFKWGTLYCILKPFSGFMCHFGPLPYMDWSSMERMALCVTSFNEEPCIVFWNLLVALCVTLGHCHRWTEAAWNGLPYVSLPLMTNLI